VVIGELLARGTFASERSDGYLSVCLLYLTTLPYCRYHGTEYLTTVVVYWLIFAIRLAALRTVEYIYFIAIITESGLLNSSIRMAMIKMTYCGMTDIGYRQEDAQRSF
jgi:hypothetical protein